MVRGKFFVSAIAGVILFSPFFVLAASQYNIQAPPTYLDAPVKYDGFVPCGKCLERVSSTPTIIFSGTVGQEPMSELNKQYCGVDDFSQKIYVPCQLCHVFIMVNNVFWFLLKEIVPIVAVLMLVIGGAMFFFGGVNPGLIQRGKKLITGVAIGLLLIYGCYMIIGEMLDILKLASANPLHDVWNKGVFSINCPIKF